MANEEYDSLVQKKRNAEANRRAANSRISANNAKLSRLRSAKTKVAQQKEAFRSIQREEQNKIHGSYAWQGSTYTAFLSKGENVISENYGYYKRSLDYVLDGINDEITRLENKNNSEYGLIGRLNSLINSCANEIENFFN